MSGSRVVRWTGILASYFSSQGLVQAASILAGLLFVNFLPVGEFALYTLAASVLAFLTFATDLGSTSSLLHFFHRTRQERRDAEFFEYVEAVRGLRRLAFVGIAGAVAAGLPWAARAQGFDWPGTLLATAAVLLTAALQIDASVRILALRLLDRYSQSYWAEVLGATIRLVAAGLLVAAGWRLAGLAVATAALAAAATAWCAEPGLAPSPASPPRRREVVRYLLPTLPGALYFSVQGPLVVWLAATFGGTRQIAEVGALGRLGLVVSLLYGLVGTVFLPRLARLSDDRLFLRRSLQFGLALAVLAALPVALSLAVPRWLLLAIGSTYSNLDRELRLVMLGAALSLLGGFAVGVNNARSWTRLQGLATLALCVVQVLLAVWLRLDDTAGLLLFGVLSSATGLCLQLMIAAAGFLCPARVAWRAA